MRSTPFSGEPAVTVGVLGPLVLRSTVGEVPVRGPTQAVLLALLAMADQPLPVDRLVDAVWDGDPPPSALAALRVHLTQIRRLLAVPDASPSQPRTIVRGAGGYCLEGAVDVDAAQFERLVGRAAAEDDPATRAELLNRALGLWRGEPFQGVRDVAELRREAERLQELRLRAQEDQLEARLVAGDHEGVSTAAAVLVDGAPLRERRTALLMLALYQSGRQADALGAYARLRRRLNDDLGVDPSPSVQRLEGDILRQARHLMPPSATPVPTITPVRAGPATSPVLRRFVLDRVAGLGGASRRLLELVAVLAQDAGIDVLARALRRPEVQVREMLRDLERRTRLVTSVDGDQPRLASSAAAAVLVDALEPSRLQDLHLSAARALSAARGAGALFPVVQHTVAAVPAVAPATACELTLVAVDQCLAAGQLDLAEQLLDRVAHLSVEVDAGLRLDLLLRQARLHAGRGDLVASERVLRGCRQAARELHDAQRFALAVLERTWGRRSILADSGDRELLEEALTMIGPGPSAVRVRVASLLLAERVVPGRRELVGDLSAEVERVAPAVGDDLALVTALYAQHVLRRGDSDLAGRRVLADRLDVAVQRVEEPYWQCVAAMTLAYDLMAGGSVDEARQVVARLADLVPGTASQRLAWHVELARSTLHLYDGDLPAAEQAAERAVLQGAAAGIADALAGFAVHRFVVDLSVGSVARLIPQLEQFARAQPANLLAHAGLGLARALNGDSAGAARETGHVLGHTTQGDEAVPLAYALLAESEVACRRDDHLEDLRAVLEPFSGQLIVFGQIAACYGPVDRVLGVAAHLQGDNAAAEWYFEGARATLRSAPSPLWEVVGAAEEARWLLGRGRRDEALQLALRHLPTARLLGLTPSTTALEAVLSGR